jgi:hypothetical protein
MPKTADWTKTKTQFVYRHKQSGRYHVRAFRQGREVWKALGTTDYTVARSKAKEVLQEIHKTRILSDALASKPTFGQVAERYREHVKTETGKTEHPNILVTDAGQPASILAGAGVNADIGDH